MIVNLSNELGVKVSIRIARFMFFTHRVFFDSRFLSVNKVVPE